MTSAQLAFVAAGPRDRSRYETLFVGAEGVVELVICHSKFTEYCEVPS